MVLVLTASTALIISNLFSISELIDLGITFIERLEVVRKPLNYHAFYFVEPSHNVVERIIADYDTESKALYCKVHILFSGSLERKLLRMIASCNVLMKRLARHSIRETNFSLRLLSDDSLSMNLPYLSYAYSDSPEEEAVRIPIARNFA